MTQPTHVDDNGTATQNRVLRPGAGAVRRAVFAGMAFVILLLGLGVVSPNAQAAGTATPLSVDPSGDVVKLHQRGDGSMSSGGKVGTQAVFGPYNLRAVHSNKCLDVIGGPGATGNGVHVQQYDCLGFGQSNQRWYFTTP